MSRGSILFCPPLSGAQEKEEVKELLLPQLWLTQGTEQHVTVFLVPQNTRTVRHKEILASNHGLWGPERGRTCPSSSVKWAVAEGTDPRVRLSGLSSSSASYKPCDFGEISLGLAPSYWKT